MSKWKWDKSKRKYKGKFRSCKCGCGELISYLDSTNKFREYKRGHNKTPATIKGSQNRNYKGKKYLNNCGYAVIPVPEWYYRNHSNRHIYKCGRIGEHRLVWELYYNVCLLPWGHIHHKNGIRDDNRIENLEAMTQGDHKTHHLKENNFYIGKRIYITKELQTS